MSDRPQQSTDPEQAVRAAFARDPTAATLNGLIAQRMPGVTGDPFTQVHQLVRTYIEQTPATIASIAAQAPGNPQAIQQLIAAIGRSFAGAMKLVPGYDLIGTLYGCYAAYQVMVGAGIMQADFIQLHQGVRNLLDPARADDIDRMVFAALQTPIDSAAPSQSYARAVRPPQAESVTVLAMPATEARTDLPADVFAPGQLDVTFAGCGAIVIGLQDAKAKGVACLADGRIVSAGVSKNDRGGKSMTIARFTDAGGLDIGFAATGVLRLALRYGPTDTANCEANALAVLPDDRIVVVGSATAPPTGISITDDLSLACITPDGNLDASFGSGGWLQLALGMSSNASCAAVDARGNIVVAGFVREPTSGRWRIAVLRITGSGTLDESFGIGGLVVVSSDSDEEAVGLVLEPGSGKIVVLAKTGGMSNKNFVVVRLTADGSLDDAFGRGGRVSLSVGSGDTVPCALAIQPTDGRYVVAGYLEPREYILLRFTTSGALDATFGNGGFVKGHFPAGDTGSANSPLSSFGRALAVQADGGIVLGGSVTLNRRSTGYVGGMPTYAAQRAFALARFDASGRIDAGMFGVAGVSITAVDNGDDEIDALCLADDKLIVAGTTERGLTVARYLCPDRIRVQKILDAAQAPDHPDVSSTTGGALDETFGERGLQLDIRLVNPTAMCLDAHARILVAGMQSDSEGGPLPALAVARFTRDGGRDASFGIDGIAAAGTPDLYLPYALLTPSRQIWVMGRPVTTNGVTSMLACFTADGADGELVTVEIPRAASDRDAFTAHAAAVDSNERLVLAGQLGDAFAVARFVIARAAGQSLTAALDTTFGESGPTPGLVLTAFGRRFASARTLAIQADGRVLVAGTADVGQGDNPFDFAVARYNDDGSLDRSFGDDGTSTFSLRGTDDTAHAMALQSDGSFVLAGDALGRSTTDLRMLVLRSDASGLVDRSFNDGSAYFESAFRGAARAVMIDPVGRIVVAGWAAAPSSNARDTNSREADFALVRLTATGALDSSFGENGVVYVAGGHAGTQMIAVAHHDGALVAAGKLPHDKSDNLVMARLKD